MTDLRSGAAADARAVAARLPTEPGVYRFRDVRGRVLYVGRAVNLRRRATSYWSDLDDRPHLRRMMPRVARVEAVVCASEHEAAWLERNVLQRRLPPWNRTVGGQETPVYLRLDASSAKPGLTVVYAPTAGECCFGPYLGGTRVRTAVAGLHRVFPLPYAGSALSAAQRDLARVRQPAPKDPDALVAGLTTVLRRDADAVAQVHRDLLARRDEAVRRTAFEHAARLQAEIEAVQWVLSPQRATLQDAEDLDFHGWAGGAAEGPAGGVLVRFEVRDGRLCGWQVRPCSAAVGAAQAAATPHRWAEFADRNARLAAQLRPPP